jgi:uncharacterized protein YprB with RNaseH-like and TPR domain/predicted nuclease with RNAse H fold/dephospho-CoA kinase
MGYHKSEKEDQPVDAASDAMQASKPSSPHVQRQESSLRVSAKGHRARPARSGLRGLDRAWLSEPRTVIFLDIETTGLSRYYDDLTIVGYQMNGRYNAFIAGDDPAGLLGSLQSATTLVTFNGTLFDIPFLKKTFGAIALPQVHIDLRYASRRVGLRGGQKAIERELGLTHRGGIDDVDGAAAVLLWHEYLRGRAQSLQKLIDYNFADVRGMCGILDWVVQKLTEADLLFSVPSFFAEMPDRDGHARPGARFPSPSRLGRKSMSFEGLFGTTRAAAATIVGVDLTGSEKRPSGVCVLKGADAQTAMVASDDEIVSIVLKANPEIVSIDSPLSLPKGRTRVSDDDPGRLEFGIMRICERTLKRRGINVYPCLLPSMQRLTARGIAIADRLRRLGYPVIESYPGAAQDIMGIPRKGAGEHLLKLGLKGFGVSGPYQDSPVKHDELDAITSALVGTFFLSGLYEALTGPEEGALIIPDLNARSSPLVVGFSGRIAAGKTTAANGIERLGFRYVRFSQIIDDIIIAEGLVPNRGLRQETGWRVHVEKGQKWLCEQVLRRVEGADKIVIDGLRFPEDHAYFFERFGTRFMHIHVDASPELRAVRLHAAGLDVDFESLEQQPTETRIETLRQKAAVVVKNEGTLELLNERLAAVIGACEGEKGARCQFPS